MVTCAEGIAHLLGGADRVPAGWCVRGQGDGDVIDGRSPGRNGGACEADQRVCGRATQGFLHSLRRMDLEDRFARSGVRRRDLRRVGPRRRPAGWIIGYARCEAANRVTASCERGRHAPMRRQSADTSTSNAIPAGISPWANTGSSPTALRKRSNPSTIPALLMTPCVLLSSE